MDKADNDNGSEGNRNACWLTAQLQNRDQDRLDLMAFNCHTGERHLFVSEESEVWINIHNMFKPFLVKEKSEEDDEGQPPGTYFIWASERSGFMQLYLYRCSLSESGGASATLVRNITPGKWLAESVAGIDSNRNLVYFTGYETSSNTTDPWSGFGCLTSHLYVTVLFAGVGEQPANELHVGGGMVRLTPRHGTHQVVVDKENARFVMTRSTLSMPPRVTLHSIPLLTSGGNANEIQKQLWSGDKASLVCPTLAVLHDAGDNSGSGSGLRSALITPTFFSFESGECNKEFSSSIETHTGKNGGHHLYGCMYLPNKEKWGMPPYKTVVAVYGGPHVQRVRDSWGLTVDMRSQRLASMGYAVLKCDNRGSFRRGLAFEGELKHCMGTVEVRDQVAAVQWAIGQGLTDGQHVGINGWSYGGYMSLMCLVQAPDVFHAAVSGAPVTHWDGYDTHYTERYMSTPEKNPEGYENGAVMKYVPDMKGKLMLVHGLIDEVSECDSTIFQCSRSDFHSHLSFPNSYE